MDTLLFEDGGPSGVSGTVLELLVSASFSSLILIDSNCIESFCVEFLAFHGFPYQISQH